MNDQGYGTAGAATPERFTRALDSPRLGAVDRLGAEIDRLNSALEDLESRLVNVLHPHDPPQPGADLAAPEVIKAPVHVYNDSLGYAIDRLGRIIARIEV